MKEGMIGSRLPDPCFCYNTLGNTDLKPKFHNPKYSKGQLPWACTLLRKPLCSTPDRSISFGLSLESSRDRRLTTSKSIPYLKQTIDMHLKNNFY